MTRIKNVQDKEQDKIPDKYELAREMGEAIRFGDFQKIDKLIGKGVRIEDAENPGEQPALSKAVLSGNLQAVEMLLKNGQNPNTTDPFGMSAMHFAARSDSVGMLSKLQACGGNLTTETDAGHTVLSQAVFWRANRVVSWLVDRGIDPFEPNKNGKTAMGIAKEIKSTQCIAIFSAFLARKEINNLLDSLSAPHTEKKLKKVETKLKKESSCCEKSTPKKASFSSVYNRKNRYS